MNSLAKATLAAGFVVFAAAGASAQTTTGKSGAMQMSDAECQTVWSRINPSNAASVSQTAAQGYVTDFSTADSDKNGQLSSTEFMTACRQGQVSDTASTGAAGGTSTGSGSSATPGASGSSGSSGAGSTGTSK